MSQTSPSAEGKLVKAAEYLKAGRKQDARQLLRELLIEDNQNLPAWELLFDATYDADEQVYCLNHILSLRPNHPWARKKLETIKVSGGANNILSASGSGLKTGPMIPETQPSPAASQPGRKKRPGPLIPVTVALFALVCIVLVLILFNRSGIFSRTSPASLTATVLANQGGGCQALIEQAIQASGDYCSQIGAEKVCYGNNTLQAELQPDATQRFTQRGDTIDVDLLRSLSASPLDPEKNQWGIAIFKVLANLPRSLPGQLVTMMVFGNTTFQNGSQGIQSFYFSSEFGKILCEQVPFDGILINMPDGAGVRFQVNGTDLTLMGSASLQAAKNGDMIVSLYSGSGRIVSQGQEQYFGAGQQVSVQLGGPNGTDAISPPSAPGPLSPEELSLSCAMNGQICNQTEVTLVSPGQAQTEVQANLGFTPTASLTPLPSPVKSATQTRTPTSSRTVTRTPTPTPSPTRSRTPTRTPTPTRTATKTPTLLHTYTASFTASRTATPTRTHTPTSTFTPTATFTPSSTVTSSATSTATPTNTPTFTDTTTPEDTSTPTQTLTPSETPTASNTVPSATPAPSFLVGDDTAYTKQGSNLAGVAEAFQYTAAASGTVTELRAYMHANNKATQIVIGIYTDSGGNPGSLLAQATFDSGATAVSKDWFSVGITGVPVTAGSVYWIAILEPNGGTGGLAFVDEGSTSASQATTGSAYLTLPSTWPTTGTTSYTHGPMSAYGAP